MVLSPIRSRSSNKTPDRMIPAWMTIWWHPAMAWSWRLKGVGAPSHSHLHRPGDATPSLPSISDALTAHQGCERRFVGATGPGGHNPHRLKNGG